MARITFQQANFSAGELAPVMSSRNDLDIYYKSASYMYNYYAQTQGPGIFRGGKYYAAKTKDNKKARLIRFQFSVLQSYVLELTDGFMRIYKDGGLITETPKTITAITQANPGQVTSAAHGFVNGDQVFISGVGGMLNLNVGGPYIVNNATTNTFELLGVNTTSYPAYTSGGMVARVVQVATPWTGTQIDQLEFAQTADTMYIVHQDVSPRKITRTSHTAWTISTYTRTTDPFAVGNYPGSVTFFEQRLVYGGTALYPQRMFFSRSNAYDDMTTGTLATDGMQYNLASEEVNAIQWLSSGQKYLVVGTFGGPFKVSGDDDNALTPNNIRVLPSTNFGCERQLPVKIDNVLLFTQRGGTTLRNFAPDPLSDTFKSADANLVADHITVSGIGGLSLQTGRPDVVWAWLNNGRMVGLNYKVDEQIQGWFQYETKGAYVSVCNIAQASGGDQHWVCVRRNFNGVDTYFVEYFKNQPIHPRRQDFYKLPGSNPVERRQQEAIENAAFDWALYESQKDVYHVDCGLSASGLAQGVTITPGAVSGESVTFTASAGYFLASDVGRQIWAKGQDGRAEIIQYVSSTQVICRILHVFKSTAAISLWYLTFSTVYGLQHLEGQTVTICADGGTHPDRVVLNGMITLDQQISVAHIGLGYNGLIITQNLEAGGNNGPAQTKPKNVAQLGVQFLNSLECKVGTDFYKLERIEFYKTSFVTGRPPLLFSGSKVQTVDDNWRNDKYIYIFQDKPLPSIVTGIVPYMTTNDT